MAIESRREFLISATEADWDREDVDALTWLPSRQLLRALRDYQRARASQAVLSRAQQKLAVLRHRFWSAISGADLPLNCSIEGGLLMPHPHGIVIHPGARIGPNCIVFQQVTIGTGPKPGVPELGGHVDVGPGAKILGGIRIGNHAVIGANAVVIADVPDGCVAVGVPARITRYNQERATSPGELSSEQRGSSERGLSREERRDP